MPREGFDQELHDLQRRLLAMSELVDRAIEQSIQALAQSDLALAQRIIEEDKHINEAQRDIVERCLILLATQQPMASDLRIILSIFSIASELERMADHAEGNAKIALLLAGQPLLKPLIDIPKMAELARRLLKEQLQAFIHRDARRSRELSAQDDDVDDLYSQVYHELLGIMVKDPDTVQRATYLLWAAHNLERISDRTTNIGEQVVFLTTGRVEELNPTSGR
jgi:phosphate transport system protein